MAYDTYMHLFFKKQPNGKFGEIIVENNKSSVQVGEAKAKAEPIHFSQVAMQFLNGIAVWLRGEAAS